MCVLVAQSCLTLKPHGLQKARLLCPWNFPGKNTGMGCHALLQGIFLAQGSNPSLLHLLHWRMASLPLVPPRKLSLVKCCPLIYKLRKSIIKGLKTKKSKFSSVQFSCSVVSDSLRPHEPQLTRPPCPSPTPEFTQTHVH